MMQAFINPESTAVQLAPLSVERKNTITTLSASSEEIRTGYGKTSDKKIRHS